MKEAFYLIVGDPTKYNDYLDMNYSDYVSFLHGRKNMIDEQKDQLKNNK